LGKSLTSEKKPDESLENMVRTGLITAAWIYIVISAIIIIFAKPLVVFMAQEDALVDATVNYVRLETVAALFSTTARFLVLVFITIKKDKYLYVLLCAQMIMSVVLDIFLISGLSVSAKIGVNGIAIANIIVNVTLVAVAVILLHREKIKIFRKSKLSFGWMKEWFHVGKYSGLESLLRNLAFMIMIIRMVNVVSEQGSYWVANNFIWGWLLLPGLAFADLVKKEIAESESNIRDKTFGYIALTSIFVLVWLATIPLWKPFIQNVLNAAEYETVFYICLIQTGFYLTFLFNSCIFDSTFYGLGKTSYMLIQSLCIDGLYYGVMFILYVTGIFVPTLLGISLMFGIGMTLDFIPTMIIYIRLLKKKGIKIDFRLDKKELLADVDKDS
jgi:Na+-driven multidrug efflux pump